MGDPTSDEVFTATGALRADADTWSGMSDQLEASARVAQGLILSVWEFSGLGHLAGLDAVYARLQERMTRVLDQGSVTFEQIAAALRRSADEYDEDERNAVHRMRKIY